MRKLLSFAGIPLLVVLVVLAVRRLVTVARPGGRWARPDGVRERAGVTDVKPLESLDAQATSSAEAPDVAEQAGAEAPDVVEQAGAEAPDVVVHAAEKVTLDEPRVLVVDGQTSTIDLIPSQAWQAVGPAKTAVQRRWAIARGVLLVVIAVAALVLAFVAVRPTERLSGGGLSAPASSSVSQSVAPSVSQPPTPAR